MMLLLEKLILLFFLKFLYQNKISHSFFLAPSQLPNQYQRPTSNIHHDHQPQNQKQYYDSSDNEIIAIKKTIQNTKLFSTTSTSTSIISSSISSGNSISNSSSMSSSWTIDGPSLETKPDYENIHGPMGKDIDSIFLSLFRSKMAEKIGVDSNLPLDDYNGILELVNALNARFSDRNEIQTIAQDVLRALFPSWLPGAFGVMFAKPFPEFSSRMNAWATKMAGTWLMGECEINDCEIDDGTIGKGQGLLVKRCRFLEESSCASVCVNSCKIPTQNFFSENMGLPLTMTPDYETGECQFSFGLTPTFESEFAAKDVPCLSRCPSSGRLRKYHYGTLDNNRNDELKEGNVEYLDNRCNLMDE